MRHITRSLLLIFALVPLACSAEKAEQAPADNYKPDDHYKVMPTPVETDAAEGQVQVLEFFLYTCPHCYDFEPAINKWADEPPSGVKFSRVPAAFGAHTVPLTKAFYTAEALGVLDKLHPALFKAIHEQQRKLDSEDAIAAVFVQNGVKEKDFRNTFNGFHIANLVRRSEQLTQAYRVTGVPSLAVAGKYWINPNMGRGYEGMLQVAEALVKRELSK